MGNCGCVPSWPLVSDLQHSNLPDCFGFRISSFGFYLLPLESVAHFAIVGDERLRVGHATQLAAAGANAVEAEIIFHGFGDGLEFLHDLRIRRGNIVRLTDIGGEIVKRVLREMKYGLALDPRAVGVNFLPVGTVLNAYLTLTYREREPPVTGVML
jgi:hypothetical protein